MTATSSTIFRRWLKEPLVQFFVLGAALFTLHRLWSPQAETNRVVVSDSVVSGLRQEHLRRNGALPTAEEEEALIQRFIDREVLYREALALGLDRGDVIVRRRLVQKMEFLLEDVEPVAEPTDEELEAYLREHRARYVTSERVALTHVFVSPERHGAQAKSVAHRLLEPLRSGADPSTVGDPFLRGSRIPPRTEPELAAIFGSLFASHLMSLPVGDWTGPLESSYGFHLVRITERRAARQPSLADVWPAVRRDWLEERRAAANRTALARLRERYDIRVEQSSTASTAAEMARSR